jgi:hypothetical protein
LSAVGFDGGLGLGDDFGLGGLGFGLGGLDGGLGGVAGFGEDAGGFVGSRALSLASEACWASARRWDGGLGVGEALLDEAVALFHLAEGRLHGEAGRRRRRGGEIDELDRPGAAGRRRSCRTGS